ncbi:MAG: 4-hydroxythreonine-4-phosphate dehydrogenase PdxA [Candidatus Omnitrophica bacterium]|nr:4-hydroxythreonine-4-phosphate dehydrogenase PdxA [Candidatus Omnitrophota bacterium]
MQKKNRCIGITLGDPAGIGPEVVAKALAKPAIRKLGPFKLIGDHWVYRKYCRQDYANCSFVDLKNITPKQWQIGKPNLASAKASLSALQKGVDFLKKKEITGLVTAPLSKEPIGRILPSFQGHTEFLADAFGVKNVGMMFVAGKVRTIIVTRHIPLNQVSKAASVANIYATIDLTHRALRDIFKIKKPVIGVCGVNPHAGEGGMIGREEITKVIPAIKKAKRHKMNIQGPFAADTLFSPDIARHYDAIVAMFHDQGLIPVKTLCFRELVNLTIGLPFIRTSPAHGTAFNIAGKRKADPSSMCAAIKLAAQLTL